jgi:glycosyltransferase involved in cell wall biosynthesis
MNERIWNYGGTVNEMKIDMLYDFQLEGHDAGTTHTMELFKNLKKIGNQVDLFIPKSKHAMSFRRPDILYLPLLSRGWLIRDTFYQLVLLFYYLVYRIKHTKPDVIYARISILTISPLILSKLLKIPCVVEINGLGIDELKLSNASKLIIQIYKVVEKLNYKHAEKIVAVTQGVKEGIKELYNVPDEKVVVVENGANTDLLRPMDITKARKELKFDQDANYVCFVGALYPWQGVEYLIRSAPLILKKHPKTKFLIVGDGMMKEELINLAEKTGVSDKFIFTGAVPYEEVPKYINASDVCVVYKRPFKSGYSPLKLYEYMACGKPVVASRISGFEILEEQNAGILVEPEKTEELAKAIIKLLKDEKLREEMGKNGREYVVTNHSWESVARDVAEVCESVIG